MRRAFVPALLLLLLCAPALAETVLPAGPQAPLRHPGLAPVHYELRISNPYRHEAEITMTLTGYGEAPLDVAMPAWAPGAYRLIVPARNVMDLRAQAGDRPLRVRRLDRESWRIESPPPGGTVQVRYRVHLPKPSVVRSHVATDYASISGFDTFLFVIGNLPTECRLTLTPYRDWEAATALELTAPLTYRADNYDLLIDSPILWGRLKRRTFLVGGRPHHLVWSGDSDYDIDRLASDTQRIVEAVWPMFGGPLPYREYWFLWRFEEGGSGGLEHLSSTRINEDVKGYHQPERLDRYWQVTSHEFVHAWNVKRIRPEGLGPFDYSREHYTPYLWFAEGVTSYLGDLALLRAGIWDRQRYLRSLASAVEAYEATPAREWMSAEEASLTTWHQAENGREGRVNYYNKGLLIGLLLDLELRRLTDGRVTLVTLMQALYEQYLADGKAFPAGTIEATAEQLTGADLGDWFDRTVRGTGPLPIDEALRAVGLTLNDKPRKQVAWLGVETTRDGDAGVVRVEAGSPAARVALQPGDVIAAVGSRRATGETLGELVRGLAPRARVTLTVFRGDSLLRVPVTLGARDVVDEDDPRFRHLRSRLSARGDATPEQVAERQRWLKITGDTPRPPVKPTPR